MKLLWLVSRAFLILIEENGQLSGYYEKNEWNTEANCDGCMAGLAEMYQDYIDGKKELREINMEFNARYIKGDDMPGRKSCMEY